MASTFTPGKYAVTNAGKRTRVRGGHRFPGAKNGKPTTTVVQIDSAVSHLQIRTALDLSVEPAKGGETPAPAWGTTVEEAIAYVGDDAARATEVLAAEQAGKQRKSLLEALTAVVAAAGGSGGGT